MSTSASFEQGIADGKKHTSNVDPNWLRMTFGPLVWVGVPFAAAYFFVKRSSAAAGGAAGSNLMEMMMPMQKRQFRVDVKGTKFSDVIGVPEAKEEVTQYVEFLRSPKKFTRLGARLPRACLLTGEPGTGKTLLAKAVAGEADVPFLSCSGADFIEVFGGSGPKRVRELFQEARSLAPCIVFVDEIDALGSRGHQKSGSVASEENRTINQLLAEMDGLGTSGEHIVVLAATNFQDNIDKALLREGRFDRKIPIEMPDKHARVDVFKHYLDKVITGDPNGRLSIGEGEDEKKVEPDASVSNAKLADELSDLSPGISPATCATIVNEAALESAVTGEPKVSIERFREAIDNVMVGKPSRNRMGPVALKRTALHEAGHAIVGWMLPQQKNVLKISVRPRGQALGFTQRAGNEHHEYQTNATMYSDLCVMMGGRAAEEVCLGNASAGAMDDVQRATEMAIMQFISHGMSLNVGHLAFKPEELRQGRNWASFSEQTQIAVEKEAQRLVQSAYEDAVAIVRNNEAKVKAMGDLLIEKQEVITSDIQQLWGDRPSAPTTEELVAKIEVTLAPPTQTKQ